MKDNKNEIMVSILCLTYNHEKYIKEALESFLKQKTNFSFEIIIHDDCSTDATESIIREYHQNYPDIIVPIFEKENQLQKGIRIIEDIMIPCVRGKYFAFCEGDDYWIDPLKLQRQFDFLEAHPDYSLYVHNACIVRNGRKVGYIKTKRKNATLECNDFILGGGAFVATNSIFSRSSFLYNLPEYFKIKNYDYVWQIYLSGKGKSYYSKLCMSAYRTNVPGSWTSINSSVERAEKHIKEMNLFMDVFDAETGMIYHSIVCEKKVKNTIALFIQKKEYNKLKADPYKTFIKKQPLIFRIKLAIKSIIKY